MKQIIQPELLTERVRELADEISSHMVKSRTPVEGNQDMLIVLGVLTGGAFLTVDLVRLLTVPAILGWVRVESYRGVEKRVQGPLRVDMLVDWNTDFNGRRVLIVDDILDTGSTMEAVVRHIARFDPRSIETVTLLRKPFVGERVGLDYVGFDVPDHFVIGSGLDYDGLFRDLPGVWVL